MKLATLSNFSNIGENTNTYMLENMCARKIGGQSILSSIYNNALAISEHSTGAVTNLFQYLGKLNNGEPLNATSSILFDSSGHIFEYNIPVTASSLGLIHTVYTTHISQYGDMTVTKNGNILYTSQGYLGIGVLSTTTGGSTTTLIDTTQNFTTLGVDNSDEQKYFYDITNTLEYAVTSVASQDTLNFATSTAVGTGDSYAIFVDKGKLNTGTYWDLSSGSVTLPHFVNQPGESDFKRQIEAFDTDYLIGNGKYLAMLNVDEATFNTTAKELPDLTQFECMSVNQGKILVGASCRGRGVLLLWDGFSDGWLAIEQTSKIPVCIKPYQAGFVVLMGGAIYYSTGYQIQLLTTLPDFKEIAGLTGASFNSMITVEDKIFLNLSSGGFYRDRSGIWIYESGSGWTFCPQTDGNGYPFYNISCGAIFPLTNSSTGKYEIYSSFNNGAGTNSACVTKLSDDNNGSYVGSVMFLLNFGRKVNISEVVLNISPYFRSNRMQSTTSISVAIGDCKRPLFRRTQTYTGSTAAIIQNDDASNYDYRAVLKDQVRLSMNNSAGERTYVSTISNGGTATEEFVVNPAFGTAPLNTETLFLQHLQLCDTKSLNSEVYQDEMPFVVEGFYGDKCFLEVYWSTTTGGKFDINSIDIFGS